MRTPEAFLETRLGGQPFFHRDGHRSKLVRPTLARAGGPVTAALIFTFALPAALHAQATSPGATAAAPTKSDSVYIAKARADSLLHPYTQADVDFMTGMIAHHAQAIVMARWAPTHGASPSVQTLASRIINAQTDEIVIMQRWLRDRRQPVPEASAAGMKMMMNGTEQVMLMPGMLTEAQLRQLDQARDSTFDRLFLTFMIQHHKGAVAMVQQLFSSYGAAQDDLVFKFAADVNIDQTTEIARMGRMLVLETFVPVSP